jgi:hypothetical protein
MKMSLVVTPLLGALALLICSCTPSTPQTRIQERPGDFAQLSAKQKNLVSRGEIDKGMSQSAVSLAWGSPSGRVEGFRDGEYSERWNYYGQRAVVTHSFHGGYSSDFGHPFRHRGYHRGYHPGYHADFGPEIVHIPYRKASVWFVDGRVNAWERLQ